jgi:hypothetical protein
MPLRALSTLRAAPVTAPATHTDSLRISLADGSSTTLHVARHPLARTDLRVVRLRRPEPLVSWCARNGVEEALVGGFYTRPRGVPLGELRTRGFRRTSVPFDAPWADVRGCLHVDRSGRPRLAARGELPASPRGDLLQAGPILLRGGAVVEGDPEGFSAGARQFDSDITAERHPRAAIALTPTHVLAVACDGRASDEAGMTLQELAGTLRELGAHSALNLDGGGSSSLVSAGELVNVPREQHGIVLPQGRAISTAIVLRRH